MHDPGTHESSETPTFESGGTAWRPLRVWPAVVLLLVLWGCRLVPELLEAQSMPIMMTKFMGPLVAAALVGVWWLFFSRALWREKIIVLVGVLAILFGANALADKSVQGMGIAIFGVPWGITAFTLGLVFTRALRPTLRCAVALLCALAAFGFWDLVRTDEIWGDFRTARSWRWETTPEERNLAAIAERAASPTLEETNVTLATPEWSGFRGERRNSVQTGIAIDPDWESHAPRELWRIPVGPGWSSFAVAGQRIYTQEQRGDDEVVACYDATNGAEIWHYQYASRFWEVISGAGPRSTPTLSDGSLFAFGANGLLHRLDPITGDLIWSRDVAKDAERGPPTWGFSASPLVVQGMVIVHAGGDGDAGVIAYDCESGEPRWQGPAGNHSYSSAQHHTFAGRSCVLMQDNAGLTIFSTDDGAVLSQHPWDFEGYRVVQPLVLDGTDGDPPSILLGTPMGTGTRRVAIHTDSEAWNCTEMWTSRGISPYYNDYVAYNGYLYGFDNNIFACVDLESGKRQWKRGRYGNGQVLLLADQGQLLVISEDGELVLLDANPEKLTERARHQVLDGRTWNHPVLVGNRLYVRNDKEAACFEVTLVAPPEA